MECRIGANRGRCSGTYETCPRKGRCCECLSYHLEDRELPACAFPPGVEGSFDRSSARFVQVCSGNGEVMKGGRG